MIFQLIVSPSKYRGIQTKIKKSQDFKSGFRIQQLHLTEVFCAIILIIRIN